MVSEPLVGVDSDVRITRVFEATPEKLFVLWTNPEHLVRWYAPAGCTIEFRAIDVRAQGRFHSCIRTPEGYECWCIGIYHEVIPGKRLVYSMQVADAEGNPAHPAERGMDPTWPAETWVTITFEDLGGRTRLTLHQDVSLELAKRTGAYPSWLDMLGRLDGLL